MRQRILPIHGTPPAPPTPPDTNVELMGMLRERAAAQRHVRLFSWTRNQRWVIAGVLVNAVAAGCTLPLGWCITEILCVGLIVLVSVVTCENAAQKVKNLNHAIRE